MYKFRLWRLRKEKEFMLRFQFGRSQQACWRASRRLSLATALLLIGLPAQAQRTTLFDLNQAICANEWTEAIALTGQLIASETTTEFDRQSLLLLRRRLEHFRADGAIINRAQSCHLSDPYLLSASPIPEPEQSPLGWDAAVAEVTENQYARQVLTETPQLTLPISVDARDGLSPAQPVNLEQGISVVSGHVGPGHEVYAFVAGLGDRIDVKLEVTQVMTGTLYTSDDSQLFVFDKEGQLLAASDDENGNQSHISGLVIPKTDLYFAVVTSYNNDPIFNQDNQIMGWQDNGGGRFDYTLSVSGATPTSALVR